MTSGKLVGHCSALYSLSLAVRLLSYTVLTIRPILIMAVDFENLQPPSLEGLDLLQSVSMLGVISALVFIYCGSIDLYFLYRRKSLSLKVNLSRMVMLLKHIRHLSYIFLIILGDLRRELDGSSMSN